MLRMTFKMSQITLQSLIHKMKMVRPFRKKNIDTICTDVDIRIKNIQHSDKLLFIAYKRPPVGVSGLYSKVVFIKGKAGR